MPDEFNISGENRQRAQKLADGFQAYAREARPLEFEREEDGDLDRLSREFAGETPVGDVAEDVKSVSRLLYFARYNGQKVPVVEIEGVGKIPVIQFDFPIGFWRRPPWHEEEFWWWWRRSLSGGQNRVMFISAEEMFEGFGRGLSLFLGYRLEGFDLWRSRSSANTNMDSGVGFATQAKVIGSSTPPPPGTAAPGASGFYIKLSCLHHHLAAYASPAYALTWRNLGSFTTPASGVLPPGTWIFGAQGGIFPSIIHDPTPVYIPPTFTPSTTCF